MEPSSSNAQDGSSNKKSDRNRQQEEEVKRIMKIPENHYQEILGIPLTDQTPQPKEVTSAYRKLARLVHPDMCQSKDDDDLKEEFKQAFQRLENACETLKGDVERGQWFHPSAHVDDDDDSSPDRPPPQEETPPTPDDWQKDIYKEVTPIIKSLINDPTDEKNIYKIHAENAKIVQRNRELKKPKAEQNNNTIQLTNMLLPHYQEIAALRNKPYTRQSRVEFLEINNLLKMINEREGYPSTWVAEAPSEWPQDTEDSSQPGKGKGRSVADQAQGKPAAGQAKGNPAAEQAKGQDAAAAPLDPDPNFKGVRTRDNEPILGWRRVGRDGRQYLVQTGSPEHPAFELRSQAGDDGVGRRAGRAYEASRDAVELGVIDKKFTKDDASRYIGITGVAYKPLQVVSDNYIDRYPVTLARAKFQNPSEEHFVFRTTVRRVAGKRDADLDIHAWSKSHGFVPSDEAPPRKILTENKAYAMVFPGRARARIRADDEDRALPEPEIKTLTDGQEELRTRLDKFEKETNDRQKSLSDEMASFATMMKSMSEQMKTMMETMNRMAAGSSSE